MRRMSKWFKWLSNRLLKIFGDIKVFHFPFFIIYDPGGYLVTGPDTRQAMLIVKPGDLLVRGYMNYLDGYFIPGYFSHVGLYLGNVRPEDIELVQSARGKELFRSGEQIVAHAMAEGVFMEDFINFCRCDYMVILRFPEQLSARPNPANADISAPEFTAAELKISEALRGGQRLMFADVFKTVYNVALSQIGKAYDFQLNFANYNNLSCTEFVYYCIKSLEPHHHLSPARKRFLIFDKVVLTPDAFVTSDLPLVWQSKSVQQKKLDQIRGHSAPTS